MPREPRILTAAQAIREASAQLLAADEKVILVGEGVPDPKGIFGTTVGLREEFGERRVFDMPVSENGMTGILIGAALGGLRPILTHQRLDFALYSLDQIINNAAKWHFMFGPAYAKAGSKQAGVPLTVRMMIGHGWGQGAQHSQNLQALFGHIPGLKVVMPSTAYDAKGLLVASVRDNNPVMFLEHRWVHGLKGEVPEELYEVPLGKAQVVRGGADITIVSSSYMTVEALRAAAVLEESNLSAEVVDLRTIKPLDMETIMTSLQKTGRLLVVDSGWMSGGVPAEIITRVATEQADLLRQPARRLTLPDIPTPTSPALTKTFYNTYRQIAETVMQMVGKDTAILQSRWQKEDAENPVPHDVPDQSFTGPF